MPLTDPYPSAVLLDNPQFYYRTAELSGTKATDSSGNGNDGTYEGGYTLGINNTLMTSGAGLAVQLNGSSGYVQSPVPALSGFGPFSFECILYAGSITAQMTLLGNQLTVLSQPQLDLLVDPSGSGQLLFVMNSGVIIGTGANTLAAGTWYHAVFTYDLTTATIYLNGVPFASSPYALAPTWSIPLLLGAFDFAEAPNPPNIGAFFGGNLTELAGYNFTLTAARVAAHYAAIFAAPSPPVLDGVAGDDRHYWRIEIYKKDGSLADIPQTDVKDFEFGKALNGGDDSDSKIVLQRNIDNIGEVAFLNHVLFWMWNGRISRPDQPYWGGFMEDIDLSKLKTTGEVTVSCVGNAKVLDRAITDQFSIAPGVAGNPTQDGGLFLQWLLLRYMPPGFGSLSIPTPIFNMLPQQFYHLPLGQSIDQVLKSGRDNTGHLYVWRVVTSKNLGRTLVVQQDQDPNTVPGVNFVNLFGDGSFTSYKVTTKYRDIKNVLTIIGGTDPTTNEQVQVVVADNTSIALFGPFEGVVSVPGLLSNLAAAQCGNAYLPTVAYPQGSGDIELTVPDPSIRDGTWLQIFETASVIKQVRVGTVKVRPKQNRLMQTLSVIAPTPFLDKAIYDIAQAAQLSAGNQQAQIPLNDQENEFSRSPLGVTGTT